VNFSDLRAGVTGCYIDDLWHSNLRPLRLAQLPGEVAAHWAAMATPETSLGCGKTAREAEFSHGRWLNKLWVVVDDTCDAPLALYNHDGKFYLYKIEEAK